MEASHAHLSQSESGTPTAQAAASMAPEPKNGLFRCETHLGYTSVSQQRFGIPHGWPERNSHVARPTTAVSGVSSLGCHELGDNEFCRNWRCDDVWGSRWEHKSGILRSRCWKLDMTLRIFIILFLSRGIICKNEVQPVDPCRTILSNKETNNSSYCDSRPFAHKPVPS